MTSVIFAILFGLIFVIFPCKGQISLPPGGDSFVVLPGENVTLAWKLDVSLSAVLARSWTFLPNNESFADIGGNAGVVEKPEYAPGPFRIEKPSTLILENVTTQYSGIYRFGIYAGGKSTESDVTVTVAVKPNVTINCTNNLLTINEGSDFTCLCEAKDGKPPADVTWEEDGLPEPGGSGKEQKLLSRVNVSVEDSGTYTCVGKSYTLTNNKSIEVEVKPNAKPENAIITLSPKRANVGEKVTITCTSSGVPEPKYNITLNGTEVSTEKTYIIPMVNKTHAGTYKCFVWNKLGSDSDSDILTVVGPITTSTSASSTSHSASSSITGNGTGTTPGSGGGGTNIGLIVGIIIGVLALLVIAGIVLYCYKSKEKDGRNRANIDPVPGNHYELENEEPGPGDGAYDSVGPVGASSSKSKPPAGNTLPPVYAAVDKNNRQGNTLYASLDTDAMQSSRASKKEPDRPPQTEYASIDFKKSAPKADLV